MFAWLGFTFKEIDKLDVDLLNRNVLVVWILFELKEEKCKNMK